MTNLTSSETGSPIPEKPRPEQVVANLLKYLSKNYRPGGNEQEALARQQERQKVLDQLALSSPSTIDAILTQMEDESLHQIDMSMINGANKSRVALQTSRSNPDQSIYNSEAVWAQARSQINDTTHTSLEVIAQAKGFVAAIRDLK